MPEFFNKKIYTIEPIGTRVVGVYGTALSRPTADEIGNVLSKQREDGFCLTGSVVFGNVVFLTFQKTILVMD